MELQRGFKKTDIVDKAERLLQDMGFINIKVRNQDSTAIIEVENFERVSFFDLDIMDKVNNELKKIGFKYVTLDLTGYKKSR